MEIKHIRNWNINKGERQYCISKIYVDGVYVCDAIEDIDRGLSSSMSLEEVKKIKVYSKTAIPTGVYKVTLNVVSAKFGAPTYAGGYYKKFCNGKVPRILNVKGFEGILIHKGINERSSAGCVIVGKNTYVGGVSQSQECFEKLYKLMKVASDKGETITYTITRNYK